MWFEIYLSCILYKHWNPGSFLLEKGCENSVAAGLLRYFATTSLDLCLHLGFRTDSGCRRLGWGELCRCILRLLSVAFLKGLGVLRHSNGGRILSLMLDKSPFIPRKICDIAITFYGFHMFRLICLEYSINRQVLVLRKYLVVSQIETLIKLAGNVLIEKFVTDGSSCFLYEHVVTLSNKFVQTFVALPRETIKQFDKFLVQVLQKLALIILVNKVLTLLDFLACVF